MESSTRNLLLSVGCGPGINQSTLQPQCGLIVKYPGNVGVRIRKEGKVQLRLSERWHILLSQGQYQPKDITPLNHILSKNSIFKEYPGYSPYRFSAIFPLHTQALTCLHTRDVNKDDLIQPTTTQSSKDDGVALFTISLEQHTFSHKLLLNITKIELNILFRYGLTK